MLFVFWHLLLPLRHPLTLLCLSLDTRCTLLSFVPSATLLQISIGRKQSKALEAGARDHVALHT